MSESAAISWIIERMELEQAKLDEFEGSDSRMVDEGDYEDGGDSGYEHLQRATRGAEAAAENRMNSLNRGNSVISSGQGIGATGTSIPSGGQGGETVGGLVSAGLGISAISNASSTCVEGSTGASTHSNQQSSHSFAAMFRFKDEDGVMRTYMPIDENLGNGSGAWNAESQYPSIIPGRYTARQRHNCDKQDILLQVSDLNIEDLYPIIMASQFSLCVQYARSIVMRALRLISSNKLSYSYSECTKKLLDDILALILRPQQHRYLMVLLPTCFKIGIHSNEQPDYLFPTLSRGFADKQPVLSPFIDNEVMSLMDKISVVENIADFTGDICCYDVDPVKTCRLNHNAVSESSVPLIQNISNFLKKLYRTAYLVSVAYSEQCRCLVQILVDDAVRGLDEATLGQYFCCDWISGDGYDKIGGEAAKEVDIKLSDDDITDDPMSPVSTYFSKYFQVNMFYTKPKVFVLWSYFVLRTFLNEELSNKSEVANVRWTNVEDIPIHLVSVQFLFHLLKTCTSPNISLRHCVLDLGVILITALSSHLEGNLCSSETMIKYIAAIDRIIADSSMSNLLSSRIKFEVLNRKTHSKYATQSVLFFLNWIKFRSQVLER